MAGKIGICKLCGHEKKLIKAHIIPECFQHSLKGENNSMSVIHLNNDNRVQHVNDFMFDKGILCKDCDGSFSPSEKYTSKFLEEFRNGMKQAEKVTIDRKGNKDYYLLADNFQIKNCLLSILWRMSISGRYHFDSVNLGPLEEKLKRMINSLAIMANSFLPFTIFSLKSLDNLKAKGLSPVVPKYSYKAIDTYVLHIPEFLIFFYASDDVPSELGLSSIRNDQVIVIGEENGANLSAYFSKIYPSLPNNPRS